MHAKAKVSGKKARTRLKRNLSYLKMNYDMYLLLVPGLLYILVFNYLPMYGITIAFKQFNLFASDSPLLSILHSPWAGLDNFRNLFARQEFYPVVRNTVLISFYKLVFIFPLPILLAVLLNELRSTIYKKSLQTILYLPHFLSWAVVSGMFVAILGADGIITLSIEQITGARVSFLTDTAVFRSVLVATDAWQSVGWSSILYLAAIAGIDQQMYEAATVDGANKFHKMFYITLPGMAPTILMMFILRVGRLLDAGFEQIFVMYNPTVYEVADIIGTYVYRMGLGQMDFTLGTTVGLFNSVVSFILVMSCNALSRKVSSKSIW